MFEQSVRIRLLSERVERSSERLQLSLRQVLRFTHCVLRSFPLDRKSHQSHDLVDDLKMLGSRATRLRPIETEGAQHLIIRRQDRGGPTGFQPMSGSQIKIACPVRVFGNIRSDNLLLACSCGGAGAHCRINFKSVNLRHVFWKTRSCATS